MLPDALQHVYEVRVRVHALQRAGREQSLNRADALGADFGQANVKKTESSSQGGLGSARIVGVKESVESAFRLDELRFCLDEVGFVSQLL